jgi:hypothetical protein
MGIAENGVDDESKSRLPEWTKNSAVRTAAKCAIIGGVLVVAGVATGGLAPAAAAFVGAVAVGAGVIATTAHILEESEFAEEKPKLKKACKFTRAACEVSLAVGAGLVASPVLLAFSAGGFAVGKAVQIMGKYNSNGDVENLGSGLAQICTPLAFGSVMPVVLPLVAGAQIAGSGAAIMVSSLVSASSAAVSGSCYVASDFLERHEYKKAASVARLAGHAFLGVAATAAVVTSGVAIGTAMLTSAPASGSLMLGAVAIAVAVPALAVGASVVAAGKVASLEVVKRELGAVGKDLSDDLHKDFDNVKDLVGNVCDVEKKEQSSNTPSNSAKNSSAVRVGGTRTGYEETLGKR